MPDELTSQPTWLDLRERARWNGLELSEADARDLQPFYDQHRWWRRYDVSSTRGRSRCRGSQRSEPAMSVSEALCYLTIGQAASLIQRRALSPVELTHAHLARIERLDGRLLRRRLRLGALVTAEEYLLAQRGRSLLRRGLLRALAQVDLIVTPTSTRPPTTVEAMNRDPDAPGSGLNRIYNLAGVPAISAPAGFSRGGLPIGVQLAGRPFAESTMYRLAHANERANPWHTMHPDLGPIAPLASSPNRPALGVAG